MPRFSALDPRAVVLGRGRAPALEREPFREHVRAAEAGRILIAEGEDPDRMRRLLRVASREVGIRIRCSFEDSSKAAIIWKRTGAGGARNGAR